MRILICIIVSLILYGCGEPQVTDVEYVTKAKQHMAEKRFNAAVIELKNAVSKNPNNTEARILLGELYLKRGQGQAAEKELGKAIAQGATDLSTAHQYTYALLANEDYDAIVTFVDKTYGSVDKLDSRLMVAKANAYLGNGDVGKALALLEEAKSAGGADKDASTGIAKVLIFEKKYDEAVAVIDNVIAQDPGFEEAIYFKALVLFRQAKYEESNKLFLSLLNRLDSKLVTKRYIESNIGYIRSSLELGKDAEANKIVDALLARKITHPDLQFFSALKAYKSSDLDNARLTLQHIVKDYTNHYPSLFLLGAIHFTEGSYEQANSLLSVVVKEIPSHIQARKILGLARINLRQLNEVDELFVPVLEADVDNSELFTSVAQAAANIGDFNLSIAYLEKAEKAKPASNDIKVQLAQAYIEGGRIDDGLYQLNRLANTDHEKYAELLKAIAYLRMGDINKASKVVNAALKKEETAKFLNLAAYIDLFKGRRAQAEKKLERAFGLDNQDVSVGLQLVDFKIENRQFTHAEKVLDELVLSHAKNADVYMKYAELFLKRGKGDDALSWVIKASDTDKTAIYPRKVLANYYLKQGEAERAIKLTSELQIVSPRNEEALLLHAVVQQYAGKHQEAMASFNVLKEMNSKRPEVHVAIARAQVIAKDVKGAETSLKNAKKLAKNNAYLLKEIAKLYAALGNRKQVESVTRSIAKASKASGLSDVELGDVYLSTAEFALAEKHYKAAFMSVKSKVILNKLLMAMLPQKKFKEIKLLAESWYRNDPEAVEIAELLVYVYKSEGNLVKAINILEAVSKRLPNNASVLNNLAWLYFENNNRVATKIAEKAWKINPNKPSVLDTYGWILHKLENNHSKASEILSKAVSLSPNNSDIAYHYAAVLNASGEIEKAITILRPLLGNSNSGFQNRKEAEKLLASLE